MFSLHKWALTYLIKCLNSIIINCLVFHCEVRTHTHALQCERLLAEVRYTLSGGWGAGGEQAKRLEKYFCHSFFPWLCSEACETAAGGWFGVTDRLKCVVLSVVVWGSPLASAPPAPVLAACCSTGKPHLGFGLLFPAQGNYQRLFLLPLLPGLSITRNTAKLSYERDE